VTLINSKHTQKTCAKRKDRQSLV